MKGTKIQWCDDTLNLQMGCEGCELIKGSNKNNPKCYAKILTDRYGGVNEGWPKTFEQPKIFMHRLDSVKGLKDLTGTDREFKPWLNGLPRIIFLNDMGDTFSSGMPENWFAPCLPVIARSPHIYMLLTKFPKRMAKFSQKFVLPKNLWCGVSITSFKTAFRADILANEVKCTGLKWLSVEPMWGNIDPQTLSFNDIKLLIFGGESGSVRSKVMPFDIGWLRNQLAYHKDKAIFVKQLGSNPKNNVQKLFLKDMHGGDWDEWSEDLKVREFPHPRKFIY